MAWLLQVAVLLLKRWIRFLAQEIEQNRENYTHKSTRSQLLRYRTRSGLAFKMLILTQVQYLHSQQFESINCDDLDVQELWSCIINVSIFV